MNTKSTSECPACEIKPLARNNYFTGKLLVERDFKDEQRYYVDKLRLHQKRLHGEGVVCGLEVVQHPNPACRAQYVCIQPGFAKDCCGNDILVPDQECIDITQFKSWKKLQAAQGQASSASGIVSSHTLQICVRYRECPTENIPVLYDDCGCDDTACAPNRILESYAFDLLVDPAVKVPQGCLPELSQGAGLAALNPGGTVNVTALVYDGTAHWYAIDSGSVPALYQLDAAGQNVTGSYKFGPATAKSVAVSDDGKTVYLVTNSQNQSSLVMLDATNLGGNPNPPTSTPVPDGGGPIGIDVLPLSRVAWLQTASPQFLVWDVSGATPVQANTLALTGTPGGLILGADRTRAYYIDSTAKQIGVIDTTAGALLAPLTQVANPVQVMLAGASSPDVLAVIDSTDSTVTALQTNPAGEVAAIVLVNTPLAGAVDPQKKVLYLVARTPASTYELQAFDLTKLVAGSPQLPPAGTAVPTPSNPILLATNGQIVFVTSGGMQGLPSVVAGYQASTPACPDLYELEDCDDCCQPDCLVLATIRGYQAGFAIDDPASPATDPLQDYSNSIARIDNKLGRTILPSTRKIAEVLEAVICGCACECGQPAPTTTTTIITTNPVIGLNPNLPKIIDVGWQHGGNVKWNDFINSERFAAPPAAVDLGKIPPILAIYFNQKVSGIDRQTFRVEIDYPQTNLNPAGAITFTGLYNTSRVQVCGVLVEFGPTPTPNTGETAADAWAFIPYPEFWKTALGLRMWDGQFYSNQNWPALDPPYVRITLSGDFIYAGPAYSESNLLDGDNIGGQVGNPAYSRPGPITGGKNPSGDMVEGGTFESWFALVDPSNQGQRGNLDINTATNQQLQDLPGITPALAKNIVAERKKAPFTGLRDLEKRIGLPAEVASALADLISF